MIFICVIKCNTQISTSNMNNSKEQINNALVYPTYALRSFSKILSAQRFLAYSSEVGESFRPIIPSYALKSLYGLSIGYVLADIYEKSNNFHQEKKDKYNTMIYASDLTVWHTFASMVLPALTIHSVVKYSNKGLNKMPKLNNYPKVKLWGPVALGLASIPFIIHPIDHAIDYIMDNTIRKLYSDKIKQ